MTYEEAMKQLEEIVARLEQENLPLKTALELFEKANELAKYAQKELTETSGKLYQIKKEFDKIVEEEI